MRTSRWRLIGTTCLLVASPAALAAQTKDDAEDFVQDVLGPLFGPNCNVFATVGAATNGRFLLQSLPNVSGAQRDLGTTTMSNGHRRVDVCCAPWLERKHLPTWSSHRQRRRPRVFDGQDRQRRATSPPGVPPCYPRARPHPMRPGTHRFSGCRRGSARGSQRWLHSVPTGSAAPLGLRGRLNASAEHAPGNGGRHRNPFTGNEPRVTGGTILDEPMRVKQTGLTGLRLMAWTNLPAAHSNETAGPKGVSRDAPDLTAAVPPRVSRRRFPPPRRARRTGSASIAARRQS
jgi:hypothetical protein